jgi:hypothetical protein
LNEAECIDASIATGKDDAPEQVVRIKTRGAYHIANLVAEFQYIDAMALDTPVTCSVTRAKLVETTDIYERITRTRLFLEYLRECTSFLTDLEGRDLCLLIVEMGLKECNVVEQRVSELDTRKMHAERREQRGRWTK